MQDLPRFQVLAATRSEEVVELSGLFNQIASMKEGHCALLVPGSDILIASSGQLRFQDPAAGTAVFKTSDVSIPEVVGLDLTYVDGMWKPYHVWMVALRRRGNGLELSSMPETQ